MIWTGIIYIVNRTPHRLFSPNRLGCHHPARKETPCKVFIRKKEIG